MVKVVYISFFYVSHFMLRLIQFLDYPIGIGSIETILSQFCVHIVLFQWHKGHTKVCTIVSALLHLIQV